MVLSAIGDADQKADASSNAQHQQRTMFDFIE
jgi:hypothetical protein